MLIRKGNNRIFEITLSAFELAALISSARYLAQGSKGEFTQEAIDHLKQVLANYDKATARMNEESAKEKT